MRIILFTFLLATWCSVALGNAIIDPDITNAFKTSKLSFDQPEPFAITVFLKSAAYTDELVDYINAIQGSKAEPLHFMPAIIAIIPRQLSIINAIASHPFVAQISSNKPTNEELELSAQAILLRPSNIYPNVDNWWNQHYTGEGVIGLIDSGVDVKHPGLSGKQMIIRQEPNSDYDQYKQGVRSPHATGVACIYAGMGQGSFMQELGMAYGTPTIVAGLADDGEGEPMQLLLTMNTLDWMLTRSELKPTVINYSNGNGPTTCSTCTDWSALAKIVDYIVNHDKILWVKSAGNLGFVKPRSSRPYQSTMTTPADNYNALTVANMDTTFDQNGTRVQSPDRSKHAIRYTSSRGPTLNGRRKPDITAPGHDTRTCAPDPIQHGLTYTNAMDYHDGYRLMGGTSSAAPHVGSAVLILQQAGITNPMAAKALLINSADAWTDSGHAGPLDPKYTYQGDHHPVMGSEWNRTYGWGYLNMQQAFAQRHNLIEDNISPNNPTRDYAIMLPIGGKVTLVHERRVGYRDDGTEWQLSHLTLELYDADTLEKITEDNSAIDSVHQVANCDRKPSETQCSEHTTAIHAIVRVKLHSSVLDGSQVEPYALAFG